MECGPSASNNNNPWFPSSLTDADFRALSLEAAQTRAQSGHGELGYGGLGHGWGLDGHGKADGKTGGQADGSASCQPNCQPNCQLNSAALDTDRDLAQDPAREPARIHDAQYSQAFSHRTRVLAAGLELAMETALEQAIVYRNLSVPELVEHALLRAEGGLSDRGALCVKTLPYSGITPSSYYRVCPGLTAGAGEDGADEDQAAQVADLAGQVWGGALQPMDPATFDGLYGRVLDYIQDRSLYQCDGSLGALLEQPGSPPRLRVVCELASQVLMARQWLGQAVSDQPGSSHTSPDPGQLTVIALPGLKGEPLLEPLIQAEVFIAVDAARGLALVAGSRHGGDLWGAIAALCAEVAAARSGDLLLWQRAIAAPLDLLAHPPQSPAPAALFLGAAGSGKQRLAASLSPDWQRGPWVWRSQGQIQPLLQGNYGRISSPEAQQSAYPHLGFGAVLENVPLEDSSSNPSFGDRRWGGAMAAAWPCPRPPSLSSPSYCPQAIFLLVADTSGLFPLLAKLSPAQAIYLVALGYGAALPGWERHLLQPQMLFGTADPQRCLRESLGLRDRLQAFPDTALYLLNTGWLGEMPSPGRSLDQRIPLSISQTLVKAALGGAIRWKKVAVETGADIGAETGADIGAETGGETSARTGPAASLGMLLNWTIPAPVLPEVRLSEAGPTRSLDGLFGQHPAQAWSQPEQWHAAAAQLAQEFDRQMAFLVSVGLPPAIAQQQPF